MNISTDLEVESELAFQLQILEQKERLVEDIVEYIKVRVIREDIKEDFLKPIKEKKDLVKDDLLLLTTLNDQDHLGDFFD